MARRVRAEGIEVFRQSRLYPAQSKRLPPDARAALAADFDRLTPDGLAGTAEALVLDVNAAERLGELCVPTLVVIGDRDREFGASAPGFIARLPSAWVRSVVIADAGHAANIEHPAAFNDAVIRFAEEIGYLA
jgi:pimeloyl-ACP methyl ester carboxylesterase